MLEASITSLRFGFDHLLQSHQDPERLRQAVMDVHVGIELLLKQRLHVEDPLLMLEKVDEVALLDAHRARLGKPVGPGRRRNVGFLGALYRLDQLGYIPSATDHRRLKRLNELRNQLVHEGSSADLDEGLRLVAGDAVAFVDAFLREQLGQEPAALFGTNLWTSVMQLSRDVSNEFQRALQKKFAQHRARLATFTAEDQLSRGQQELEFVGMWQTVRLQCPACDADACAGIDVEGPDEMDEEGFTSGGGPFLALIECPVCGLKLTDEELDEFQAVVSEAEAQAAPDYNDWER